MAHTTQPVHAQASELAEKTAADTPLRFLCDLSRHGGMPRILLIAAHPDDETIGAGALIPRLPEIQIIHVTDGSPLSMSDAVSAGFSTRQAYAEARQEEAREALALAGVKEDAISNLRFTDQQVALHMEELTKRILEIVDDRKPEVILTHAYEGGHPDHDSVALACHLARKIRCKRNPDSRLEILEFTGYHANQGGILAYEFLRGKRSEQHCFKLSSEERDRKIRMLRTYRTQWKTLQPFLSPLSEIFRNAPEYDFSCAPHLGKLYYEYFNWGVNGVTWRKLAAEVRTCFDI